MARRIMLVVVVLCTLFVVSGCACFSEPAPVAVNYADVCVVPGAMQAGVGDLNSGALDKAIRAAKPGVPR